MKVGAAPDIHKLQRPGSVDHSAEACLDSGFLQDTAERHEVQESALTAEIFKALYCVADSVRLLHQETGLDRDPGFCPRFRCEKARCLPCTGKSIPAYAILLSCSVSLCCWVA